MKLKSHSSAGSSRFTGVLKHCRKSLQRKIETLTAPTRADGEPNDAGVEVLSWVAFSLIAGFGIALIVRMITGL